MDLTPDISVALANIVGSKGVVSGSDQAPFLTEWRGRWQGRAAMVLAPKTPAEAAQIVKLCSAHEIAIVPQGGNTGLVGGQIPDGEVLVSMGRMRTIRDVSVQSNTLTVEAGVTLAEAQQVAADVDRLFPLSIGSEGTCQIGGVISTNAGGVNVIRYGNMRDLVLGLEVVLPNGDIWNGLSSLRKDNTGYDLKQLFIGGEGTLGLVTAATVKLHPRPRDVVTVFAATPTPQAAVELLSLAQEASGGLATSFELMSSYTLELVQKNIPNQKIPLKEPSAWYVLMEFSAGGQSGLRSVTEELLTQALETGLVTDAVLAENETQANALWALRHNASAGMKPEGFCVKADVSLPIHLVPVFLTDAAAAVQQYSPGGRVVAFGHLGDGNIHYDILCPKGGDEIAFEAGAAGLERVVHDSVVAHNGSISAEHGIGQLKRDELKERQSATEACMMQAIKKAFDPKGLMNPGKML